MNRKIRKMSADDQRAIDAVLDHGASGANPGLTRVAAPVQQQRLTAATNILSLLSELPVSEPPADLVSRTMSRIDHETIQPVGQRSSSISATGNLH